MQIPPFGTRLISLEDLTGGIYLLTVTLDAAYLATEGLTYPIYVDPTLSYMSSGDVETTAVYSGSTMLTQPCGNEMIHYVGYREMPYSQGRMLVRLNALKDNVLFRSLSADQVTSVTLNLMSAGGGSSPAVIHMYQFSGDPEWTPTGANWSESHGSSFTVPYCRADLTTSSGSCSLDITKIAQGWVGFDSVATTKASQGIILLNSNSVYPEFSRRFYGSQSFTGVLPTVTVTYTPTIQDGTYFVVNQETNHSLQINGTTAGSSIVANTFYGNANCQWTFTLQPTGYYTIQSVGSGLYLSVPSNDTTGVGGITLSGSATARGSFWAVIPTDHGGYALMASPVASNSGGQVTRVLSLPSASASGGTVGQYTYVNEPNGDNQQDEWFIGFTTRLEPQEQANWCWAACARMVSMNYGISPISQASAAVYIKTGFITPTPSWQQINEANKTATCEGVERTLEYLLGAENVYSRDGYIYSEEVLQELLDASNPVIILRGEYDNYGYRESGHFIVIYDYYWDSSYGCAFYRIFDPWMVNEGNAYSKSYAALCNGRDAVVNEERDNYLWEGVIVCQYGDYLKTIPGPEL